MLGGSRQPVHLVWVQVDEVVNKLIWRLRFDLELLQRRGRKVVHIVGDNHACAAANGGREDVPVVQVRQIQCRHKLAISSGNGVGSMLVIS